MRWIRIAVQTNPAALDAVAAAMEARGTGGTLFETGTIAIGFLPADDRFETSLNVLRDSLKMMPALGVDPAPAEITLTFVEDEEWATAWRQYFKPARITDRITISPTWVDYLAEPGELVIHLDPGMAFGTGGHPTTCLCLSALEGLLSTGDIVADVGTGSGVLAIGAILLGAGRVAASDTDPIAVKVALENVEANEMSDRISVREADRLQGAGEGYDVVVTNILPNVVRALAPAAFTVLKPGGTYLVSGLTLPHEPDVAEALVSAGFTVENRWESEQWVALAGRKPA